MFGTMKSGVVRRSSSICVTCMMGRHAMCHVHDGQACYVSRA